MIIHNLPYICDSLSAQKNPQALSKLYSESTSILHILLQQIAFEQVIFDIIR